MFDPVFLKHVRLDWAPLGGVRNFGEPLKALGYDCTHLLNAECVHQVELGDNEFMYLFKGGVA